MSYRIAVDPSVIWKFTEANDAEAFKKGLSSLFRWLESWRDGEFESILDQEALLVLWDESLIPVDASLRAEIARHGLSEEFDGNEIAKLINEVILNSPKLGGDAENDIPLAGVGEIDVTAPTITEHFPAGRWNGTALSLANFSIAKVFGGLSFMYALPDINESLARLRVSLRTAIDETGSDRPFSCSLDVVSSIRDAYRLLDAESIWREARSTGDLCLALKSYTERRGHNCEQLKKFKFMDSFLETARRVGGLNGAIHSVLLGKVFLAASGNQLLDAKVFRTTEKSNSGPRLRGRDGAVAQRAHVTESHEAYRLMFWLASDGSIDFANVGPKFEEVIIE